MKAVVYQSDFLSYRLESLLPISIRDSLTSVEATDFTVSSIMRGFAVVLEGDNEKTLDNSNSGPDVDVYVIDGEVGKIGLGYIETQVLDFSGLSWAEATVLAKMAMRQSYKLIFWAHDSSGEDGGAEECGTA